MTQSNLINDSLLSISTEQSGGLVPLLKDLGLFPKSAIHSLPGADEYRLALRRAFMRALQTGDVLTILVLDCADVSNSLLDQIDKQIDCSLRTRDELFRCPGKRLIAILPGVPLRAAQSLGYLAKALFDRPAAEIRVSTFSYPDTVQTCLDLETASLSNN